MTHQSQFDTAKSIRFQRSPEMSRPIFEPTPENLTLLGLLIASTLSLACLSVMISTPKALFGGSLSAISPSLFPSIVLVLLAAMCIGTLALNRMAPPEAAAEGLSRSEWLRAIALFGIMTLYALTMGSFGFLISSAIATALIALQMGARGPLQIACVALVAPVLLYLGATRLLAVSLPELSVIEFAYARLLPF